MKVLVIVDVQKEFNKFIQHDLVDELYEYAEKFKKVYQIWDTHKTNVAPTYKFPNEVDSVKKKYGKNHFSDKVKEFIKEVEDETFEGNIFKLKNDVGYIVRVDNNHNWFYVNPEIVELIEKLKNDTIILVGGADNECLEDVYQAFKAFGLNVHINKKYVYSAKTSNKDSINESNTYKYNVYCPDKKSSIEFEDFLHKNNYTWIGGSKYLIKSLSDDRHNINDSTFTRIDKELKQFAAKPGKTHGLFYEYPKDILKIKYDLGVSPDYSPKRTIRRFREF